MRQRRLEFSVALHGLLVLLPILVIVSIAFVLSALDPVLFSQSRVGWGSRDLLLLKFRTMTIRAGSEKGASDAGDDSRVAKVGRFLLATKPDKSPQLWNIIWGDMAIVGPRLEVRKWVKVNPDRWAIVHALRPGITDPVAIVYWDEQKVVAGFADPERFYREQILPSERDAMGRKGREYVLAHHDYRGLAQQFLEVLRWGRQDG